jgi:MurNAc alpha-1-phosphate uridylyltransferase
MTIPMPKRAFILAGGAGKRLRPYTEQTPKALLQVGDKTLLQRTLLNAQQAGIQDIYISLYYRIPEFQAHLNEIKPLLSPHLRITLIEEEELLGTGGSIVNVMSHLAHEPFFILQTNIVWDEEKTPALTPMAQLFDPQKMDVLVLMQQSSTAPYYEGRGDYFYDATTGQASYNQDQQLAPYVTAGIRLVHPRLFENVPDGAFPLSTLMARAQQEKRFYALSYTGDWWAIDTKAQYLAAQRHFQQPVPEKASPIA